MSGAYTPPRGTVPRAAVAGLYQGQVVSTGSASGVLNESNEVSQAENLDLEEVVFETVAGAGFGLMGGSLRVVDGFFNGVAASAGRHMERITGGGASLWTENVGKMVAHGIEPPNLRAAAP